MAFAKALASVFEVRRSSSSKLAEVLGLPVGLRGGFRASCRSSQKQRFWVAKTCISLRSLQKQKGVLPQELLGLEALRMLGKRQLLGLEAFRMAQERHPGSSRGCNLRGFVCLRGGLEAPRGRILCNLRGNACRGFGFTRWPSGGFAFLFETSFSGASSQNANLKPIRGAWELR